MDEIGTTITTAGVTGVNLFFGQCPTHRRLGWVFSGKEFCSRLPKYEHSALPMGLRYEDMIRPQPLKVHAEGSFWRVPLPASRLGGGGDAIRGSIWLVARHREQEVGWKCINYKLSWF